MSGYIDADEQSEAAIRRHEACVAYFEFVEWLILSWFSTIEESRLWQSRKNPCARKS